MQCGIHSQEAVEQYSPWRRCLPSSAEIVRPCLARQPHEFTRRGGANFEGGEVVHVPNDRRISAHSLPGG